MNFHPAPLFVLALAFTGASAATLNLLQPEWRPTWLTVTEKETPIKVTFAEGTGWMTVSRPGALFNPAIVATHFGAKGPLPLGAKTPPEITLAKIGDSIGVRVVFIYNQEALKNLSGNSARLILANSQGTRQDGPLSDIKNPIFDDDSGWHLLFGQGKTNTSLYHRPSGPGVYKNYIVTSLSGGKKVHFWENPPPVGFIKPGQPVEAIFSLTRSGPEELKVYGFIASHEVEHTATGVTDFSFDTVYFHYPNGSAEPGASFTIREFQLMTP